MKGIMRKQTGFTIVELLIVIVVIGILAAITIVAYNGVKDKAVNSQVQSALAQVDQKVLAYAATHSDQYPDSLTDADVAPNSTVSYQYTSDNTTTPGVFAITASNGPAGTTNYYVTNANSKPTVGIAPGHNLIVWDKTNDSTAPIDISGGAVIDTSTYHTATSSVRLNPGASGKSLRDTPIVGDAGQVVTVSLWIKTDSSWDGKSNNSKIRFGSSDGANTLLAACSYAGVKTSWTQVTCTHAFTSAYTSMNITVTNDGTTGSIWLDDISMSIQ